MRIDLLTPFAEKDLAKSLGARWDGVKKVWFIENVSDLTPFARWLPNDRPINVVGYDKSLKHPVVAEHYITGPSRLFNHGGCDCSCLPWENCIHSKS